MNHYKISVSLQRFHSDAKMQMIVDYVRAASREAAAFDAGMAVSRTLAAPAEWTVRAITVVDNGPAPDVAFAAVPQAGVSP